MRSARWPRQLHGHSTPLLQGDAVRGPTTRCAERLKGTGTIARKGSAERRGDERVTKSLNGARRESGTARSKPVK